MALIKCQNVWLEQLDRDADLVTAFSFYFTKAFDSVSHRVLCKNIVSCDINPYFKNWIMSFLCDRQQKVVVDGVVTSPLNIKYRGIPQETASTLIVLYNAGLMTPNLQSPKLITYADDITASVSVAIGLSHTDSSSSTKQQTLGWW